VVRSSTLNRREATALVRAGALTARLRCETAKTVTLGLRFFLGREEIAAHPEGRPDNREGPDEVGVRKKFLTISV